MLKKIIRELKRSGAVCLIYRKGVYDGTCAQIQDYDEEYIQIAQLEYDTMEVWSQCIIPISDIAKLDYYHKGATEKVVDKGFQSGLKKLPVLQDD